MTCHFEKGITGRISERMDFTMNTQHPPKLPVKEVVYNAVQALTGGDTTIIFTNREVRYLISRQDPDFKTGNVGCELRADCVNNPKRDRHFPDRINYDYYWWVSRGHYRLYDPETDHNTIKDIAEYCWWSPKQLAKKELVEQFSLTTEDKLDVLRATAEYKEYVFDLMLRQRSTLEEFNKWVKDYRNMEGSFSCRMGLKRQIIPAMVKDVRKAHTEGKAKCLKPMLDPHGRVANYKHTLYFEQKQRCKGCRKVFKFRDMTIDHIHPRSRGGTDDLENLQLLCQPCNSSKGSQPYEEWIEKKQRTKAKSVRC